MLASGAAFSTHSRTVARICSFSGVQDFPFPDGRLFDGADGFLAPGEVLRRSDDDIYGHPDVVQRDPDVDLFLSSRTMDRHHHQQVHVAIWIGFAIARGTQTESHARDGTGGRCAGPWPA